MTTPSVVSFPTATFKAVLAALSVFAAGAFLLAKFIGPKKYVYQIDPVTGKPTGKALNIITCQFGAPTDFTVK